MFKKNSLSVEQAERILSDTDASHVFWTHSGKKARNVHELHSLLLHMPVSEYLYHVNESKNDFAIWILDVIGDSYLSSKVSGLEHPIQAAREIAARIESIEKHLHKEQDKEHEIQRNIFSHVEDWKNVAIVILCIVLFVLSVVLAIRLV